VLTKRIEQVVESALIVASVIEIHEKAGIVSWQVKSDVKRMGVKLDCLFCFSGGRAEKRVRVGNGPRGNR